MTVKGLKDFQKFVATFLYLMADEAQLIPGEKVSTDAQKAR
jgi:hypothetical protein